MPGEGITTSTSNGRTTLQNLKNGLKVKKLKNAKNGVGKTIEHLIRFFQSLKRELIF